MRSTFFAIALMSAASSVSASSWVLDPEARQPGFVRYAVQVEDNQLSVSFEHPFRGEGMVSCDYANGGYQCPSIGAWIRDQDAERYDDTYPLECIESKDEFGIDLLSCEHAGDMRFVTVFGIGEWRKPEQLSELAKARAEKASEEEANDED